MIGHFVKLLLRTFWRQRFLTAINIIGLVLGFGVSFVIYLYVNKELNVDKDIARNPNTYRLLRQGDIGGSPYLIGVTSGPFAEALLNDFPQDVIETIRIMTSERWVRYDENIHLEKNFAFADSNFFKVFNFSLDKGNAENALRHPHNIVITKSIAAKYFGDEDPINKIIRVSDRYDMVVTGVLTDRNYPSHLAFDFIANISLMSDRPWFSNWWNNALVTYVTLSEQADYKSLNAQFPEFMDKYFGDDFAANKNRIEILLQPIDKVYFERDVRYDPIPHGNRDAVVIFSCIGIFILLIALINYINLSTANSVTRAREVGIKKVLGTTQSSLTLQFLLESAAITFLAACIAFMCVEIFLPLFNEIYQVNLQFRLNPLLLVEIIVALALISLLAGLYPAFVFASFRTVNVLKKTFKSGPQAVYFRKILVVTQFAISTFLIIGTLVVNKQIEYLETKPLGFNKNALVVIESNSNAFYQERERFKNSLLTNPEIESICTMNGEPGGFHDTMSMLVEGMQENPRMRTNFVDEDFAQTFGLDFVAGRNFSKDVVSDAAHALILNEAAVKELGWTAEETIGKRMQIQMMDTTMKTVIGVVRDFHFSSLHTPIEPMVISLSHEGGNIGIRINADNITSALGSIEKAYKSVTPQYPFSYQFLDDRLNRLYRSEQLQSGLFKSFSIISILVAALGILGLATFSAVQRRKEVGVRKVLGANVGGLSLMLVKDLFWLILIAAFVSWPFAYWFMQTWLSGFTYKVSPGWWAFVTSTLATLIVAIGAAGYQSVKVALTNPVAVLKED